MAAAGRSGRGVAPGHFTAQPAGRRHGGRPTDFATRLPGNPVRPMRAFSVRRSSVNSTQPATPAEAVSPATPQRGSMPSQRGSGTAQR